MSGIGLEITFPDPEKLPAIFNLARGLRRPDTLMVMGRAVATLLRKHFTELDKENPNKHGGERTHFWGKARRSVQQPELLSGDSAKVSITAIGVAQRYYGGDIVPRTAKALTIPVHPAAYGHRAREFDDLDYIPSKSGKALAILARPNPASAHGIGEVYYVLVRRVHQMADPNVLPPESKIDRTALEAGEAYLKNLIERSAN
jgi:hypothetical protein